MHADVANSARELRSRLADLELTSIDWVAETGSTNADLVARARAGERAAVLVAEAQTAGRGRRDRSWEAPAGVNILASVLVTTTLGSDDLGAIGAALAVATADACRATGGADVTLKWPNDVIRPDGKIGGLLAEAQLLDGAWVVVAGLGLNLGWPAPGEGPPGASRLGARDRPSLIADIVTRFVAAVRASERHGTSALRQQFEAHCSTIGQRVSVHHDVEADGVAVIEGVAVGVDDHFRLLVVADGEIEPRPFDVGDVVHLRRAD